ncbi:PREDICTED: SAYSvFN domain-containing protein 1 [Ficedula albicollis]|uniref:SAYSvFN domain-containing protein 1 n=1 Tax=Ficedula albicollis TaxID=59894 RepID=UPI000359E612|nr:PREDICTED: SAYSvFN domain-containing protein 1 [Ficedula albicollis]
MDAGNACGPALGGAPQRLFPRASRGWHRGRLAPGTPRRIAQPSAALSGCSPPAPAAPAAATPAPGPKGAAQPGCHRLIPRPALWSLHALFSPCPRLLGANISHRGCLAQRRGGLGQVVARRRVSPPPPQVRPGAAAAPVWARPLLLKVLLWAVLLALFAELELGLPFFILSLLYWMYAGTRGPAERRPGPPPPYSVFNPGCAAIAGTLTAEQLERELHYRPAAGS